MNRRTWGRAGLAAAVAVAVGAVVAAAVPAISTTSPPADPGARARAAIAAGEVSVATDASGRVRYVSTPAGKPLAAPQGALRQGAAPAEAARVHVTDFASLFGVRNAADLKTQATARQGRASLVRLQQTVQGLPVIGGQLVVTVNDAGALVAINGEASSADVAAPAGPISSAAAQGHAIAAMTKSTGVAANKLVASEPKLSVYDPAVIGARDPLGPRVVWQVEVTGGKGRPDLNWYVLVEAGTGRVALSFSQVPHADRFVCDFENTAGNENGTCPGTERLEGDPATGNADVDDAYNLTGAMNNFLVSLGRNGIDDADMDLVSIVRYCPSDNGCSYENAFWTGSQLVFGDGFASADDVVGHEMTHGVTQFTSGLLYYYQSGAINESISDVLGELFDQSYGGPPTGDDSVPARWLLGEDLPIGEIRDMENPPAFDQPDSMGSSLWDPYWLDLGGVHINSGVGNKAAQLMNDGGTFGGVTVPGMLSPNNVAAVWLGADKLLTPGSDYADLAYALQQSCANLNIFTCEGVTAAIDAVDMTSPPAFEASIPQAPTCAAGQAPSSSFADLFNRAASSNLGPAWTESGNGLVFIDGSASPSGASGNAMLNATPFPEGAATQIFAQTANWIQLPASATNYLRFDHQYAFDWTDNDPPFTLGYWDGGFVDIAVSTDPTNWISLTSGWNNGPNRPIESAGDATGFGGDSRGWTSSRVDLTSYSGQQVKFRFRQQTDGVDAASAAYGWWIDNLKVYTCVKSDGLLTDYNGDGFADLAIGEPVRGVDGTFDVGAVHIAYGTQAGLTSVGSQFLSPGIGGAPGAVETGAAFGRQVATGNFNGDGYADVAISATDPAGDPESRPITVLYGSAQGIQAAGARAFTHAEVGPGACCHDGGLAAGDFNNDGYGDLAYGLMSADPASGGTVGVLYGTASGLDTTNRQLFTQASPGVPGGDEPGDFFGATLAAGDFNGDGRSDLAVGAPGEDGDAVDSGVVTTLMGSASGLTATGSVAISQSTSGVPGASELNDRFGATLAAGDVNGDGRDDLAVGAPTEVLGSANNAGMVTMLLGSATGLTGAGSVAFNQNSADVPGAVETGDLFASSLTIGDFDGDGFGDLAAGSPGEALTDGAQAGTVTVLRGTAAGLTGAGSKMWTQNTSGVLGAVEFNDQCGSEVHARRIRGAAQADLVFGCVGETSGGHTTNGAIALLPGSPTGLTATGDQFFDGEALGGGGQDFAKFGAAID